MTKSPNRHRNRTISFRMNDAEYNDFIKRVKHSGLSQQSYCINAVLCSTITTSDEIDIWKNISKNFANLESQLRGLSTNINQMAHIANGYGQIPTEKELKTIATQISDYRAESEKIWQSIRLSINQQKPMGQ